MVTAPTLPDRHVVLHDVSWDFYESLLSELDHSPGVRVTFDRGDLQIMVLSAEHEWPNHILADLVRIVAAESGIDSWPLGSATIKRKGLQRGFEPDSCFYFKHAPSMRAKRKVDFEADPAPELVIEVDVTSESLDRFPLFAAMGVSEVWRLHGGRLEFFALAQDRYRPIDRSLALPILTAEAAGRFLAESRRLPSPAWTKQVQEWVRARIGS